MKKQTASRKEMEAFLRSQKWKPCPVMGYLGYWLDPRPYKDALSGIAKPRRTCQLKYANAIAKRRKAARERAALKRAGFLYCGQGEWAEDSPHLSDWHPNTYYTRSEALSKLANEPKKSRKP